jgi:hypothetical protein
MAFKLTTFYGFAEAASTARCPQGRLGDAPFLCSTLSGSGLSTEAALRSEPETSAGVRYTDQGGCKGRLVRNMDGARAPRW